MEADRLETTDRSHSFLHNYHSPRCSPSLTKSSCAVKAPRGTARKMERHLLADPETEDNLASYAVSNAVAVGCSFFILFSVAIASLKATNSITVDIVEEMDPRANFKDIMNLFLTNSGVVSALVLAVVLAQMQVDSPTAEPTTWWNIYVSTCFLSAGFAVQGVLVSSLGLMYSQTLSEKENKRLFLHNPSILGFPVSCMITCGFMLIMQSTMYVCIVCKDYMPIYAGTACLICCFNVYTAWGGMASYRNSELSDETRQNRKKLVWADKSVKSWLGSWKAPTIDAAGMDYQIDLLLSQDAADAVKQEESPMKSGVLSANSTYTGSSSTNTLPLAVQTSAPIVLDRRKMGL